MRLEPISQNKNRNFEAMVNSSVFEMSNNRVIGTYLIKNILETMKD